MTETDSTGGDRLEDIIGKKEQNFRSSITFIGNYIRNVHSAQWDHSLISIL